MKICHLFSKVNTQLSKASITPDSTIKKYVKVATIHYKHGLSGFVL